MNAPPRFVYVEPRFRDLVDATHPELKPYLTTVAGHEETILLVGDFDEDHVNEDGVLCVKPSSIWYVSRTLQEFFALVAGGVPVRAAFRGLANVLMKTPRRPAGREGGGP